MSKRYYFNNNDLFRIIDEFYPLSGSTELEANYESFNNENLDNFINRIENVLEDVRVEDIEERVSNLDNLDFLSDQANEKLKCLFSNPNLVIYGNSSMANTMIEFGHFYCQTPNLDYEFLPLSWDSDLNNLNNWNHNGPHKVLFLVLNKRENNPIYKDIDSNNPNSYFRYEIPIEYFAGYYDPAKQVFIENKSFKLEHVYDESLTIYPNHTPSISLGKEPKEIQDFYKLVRDFAYAVYSSSDGLSKSGYEGICNQYLTLIEKLRELQMSFTPEYFSQLQNEMVDDTLKLLDELDQTDNSLGDSVEESKLPEDNTPKL